MRKKRALQITTILLILLGIIALIVAFFAYPLGLDNNAVMGSKRKILAVMGAFLLLLRPLWTLIEAGLRRLHLPERFSTWMASHPPRERQPGKLSRFFERHIWLWGGLSVLVVAVVALWYLTAGTFTRWTPYSRYFDRQADAFLAGQLSLLEQPPAELSNVKDIYNWKAREGINYLWDASYFQGKYYLYWGPVPALVASAIKLVHPGIVEDQVLVLIFLLGLTAVLAAFFTWLRRCYYPRTPGSWILLFTLTAIFCVPVFWLINRPSVYEAAIASAQFFLLLGLYAAFRGLVEENLHPGWLALSGFSLGMTVASRFSYIFTVIGLCLVVGIAILNWLIRRQTRWPSVLAFALPLLLVAVGLAWFNYARFGSITETGMKYQLTGDALPVDRDLTFSAGYISPNFYSSVLRSPQISSKFPFFTTPFILDNMWPNFVHRPVTYYSGEPVVGILPTIPFLWLAGILIVWLIERLLRWINEIPEQAIHRAGTSMPDWGIALMCVAALVQFATNMTFVMTTERYLADFIPAMILGIGSLVGYTWVRSNLHPGWRKALSVLVILLCVSSITVGLLTNMQGADHRFENNNPTLYYEIANFFSHPS